MTARNLAALLARASGMALALALCAAPAVAEAPKRTYDIAAQPLSGALRDYGRAAGQQLIFSEELVRGLQAPALRGDYGDAAALDRLLAGSGLAWRRAPSGGLMIVRSDTRPQPPAAAGRADNDPATVTELMVTGTRIRGERPVGVRPAVIGREQIETSARGSAADVLRLLPQVTALGANEEARRGVQSGPGNLSFATGVNLRGLGVDATLTLIDGHRVASSNSGGLVDTSQIPLLALERIEVVADGASALYGSDAVAGVVNFVLRHEVDGAQSMARYSSGEGFDRLNLGQSFGRTWTGGSLFVAAEYLHQTALAAADRDYYTSDLRAFGGPDLRTNNGIPGTLSVGGTTYALPAPGSGSTALVAGTANRWNRWTLADITPAVEQASGVLTFRQEIAPRLAVFVDALASRREASRRDAANETSLTVPRSNPFFVSPSPTASSVTVLYNFGRDFGPATARVTAEDVTLHGGFELRAGGWVGTLAGLSSRSRVDNVSTELPNTTRLAAALADANPATAFNPFGGTNSPALTAQLRGYNELHRRFSLDGVSVEASGPVLRLPGGVVRLAAGAETRHERLNGYDPLLISGTVPSVPETHLSRTVEAAFVEVVAPLIGEDNAVPLVESLTASLALRGERYSDVGDTLNPKLGLEWRAGGGATLFGAWGTSFKAPLLTQSRTAANSLSTTNYGLPGGAVTVIQFNGNAADLEPEEAETLLAGARFEPAGVPGLTLSASYYDIDYRNRILRPTAAEIVGALSSDAASPIVIRRRPTADEVLAYYANPLFSPTASRPPPASIFAVVDFSFANLGRLRQSGVDLLASYERETAFGDLRFDAAFTYLTRYSVQRLDGTPFQDLLNTSNTPLRQRGRASAQWRRGGWSAGGSVNYTGRYWNTTISPRQRVDAWTTLDGFVRYQVIDGRRPLAGVSVTLDVRNLLDRDPPSVANVTGPMGYDPEQASALGRVLSVTLSKAW